MTATPVEPLQPSFEDVASDIERILCAPTATGSIDTLLRRAPDAWTTRFPGLSSLPSPDGERKPLKLCIATEDIVGPVRNGGIGTTYAALAELLAQEGHDVTILYLRGKEVEVETIDHWIGHYAARGVRFVPVPDYAVADQFRTTADRWLRAPYNMLRYLLDHPMEVVHVSEWRGSAYLSLLAKRQGIAFRDTLFIVKTSSPWMWNRLYGSHPLDRAEDLVKIAAERRSVELADMVIGGSLHLLRWMGSQGYDIPRDRTFVQPNVASFETLAPLIDRRSLPGGERTPIDEIVFFGRLEARKGLFVFCQAIRRLIRQGVRLPPQISFMGKPGAAMASHPGQSTPDYIRSVTADWPVEVTILTEFQQYEAIEYLLGGARLAVMPSIIENSSMAIYETAICGIPCVATNVGGNAELICENDRAAVLCAPHPVALGDMLARAICDGGMVARPSFDNGDNLATWRRFHHDLGAGLRERLLRARDDGPAVAPATSVSVCIYYTGEDAELVATLASLGLQDQPPAEVLVAVDGESNDLVARAEALLGAHGFPARATEAFDLDAGAAFNLLARQATGERLLFLWQGATLEPPALSALSSIAASSGAAVLNYFHRLRDATVPDDQAPVLRATIIGSASDTFFRADTAEMPLFVGREAFAALGGFTTDYRVLCHDHEFISKAQLAGMRCETALLELGAIRMRAPEWLQQRGYDLSASGFRAIRPKLAAAPLSMRDLLMFAKGMQTRGSGKRKRIDDGPKKAETLLTRMMAGLAADPVSPPRPGPRKPAAARSGLLNLLDRYEGGEFAGGDGDAAGAPLVPAMSAAMSALIERGDLLGDGRIVGQFLGIHDRHLYGWTMATGSPEITLHVELAIDGRTTRHPANHHFGGMTMVPPEARRRGFVVAVPEGWRERLGGRPADYTLTIAGSALVLVQGRIANPAVPLAKYGIEGFCDASDNGIVYGWGWYPDEPERRLDMMLLIDGKVFARIRADRHRDDLRARDVGQGDYGFNVTLPRAVREEGRHRIDVIVADIGVPLVRSPMQSEGIIVEVTRPQRRRRLFP